jgi:hypothetical protein
MMLVFALLLLLLHILGLETSHISRISRFSLCLYYFCSAGQNYILSRDLATFVAKEAVNSRGYVEGHEDHDISTMAFHSPLPVHLVTVSKSQRFWEHPVKGEVRWQRIWEREQARMAGIPFEGKTFNKAS